MHTKKVNSFVFLLLMIPLTGSIELYPTESPLGPHILGWWSVLACFLLLVTGFFRSYIQRKRSWKEISLEDDQPVLNKEQRLQELMQIDTSIRTPKEKAKALLQHLHAYVGIEYTEKDDFSSLTLPEFSRYPGTEQLLQTYNELLALIYTDSKPTHAQIHTLVGGLKERLSPL